MSHLIQFLTADGIRWVNPATVAMIGERRAQGTPLSLTNGTQILVQENPDVIAERVSGALRERAG
jgi:uncharacterized protein YlzI (FlbEa/FlbD family)